MEEITELSLEDKIKGLTADIRWMKVSPIPQTKAYVVQYEAELQKLLDQQRSQKPLPARMQAASAKNEKAKAALSEATKELAAAEEQAAKRQQQAPNTQQQDKEHPRSSSRPRPRLHQRGLPAGSNGGQSAAGEPRGRSPAARSQSSEESGGECIRPRSEERRQKRERKAAKKAALAATSAEKAENENQGSGGSQ